MASWMRNIKGCIDQFDLAPPQLDHFTFEGEPEKIADIAMFMANFGEKLSLLNVDLEKELLILVKTADGVDLKKSPFFYMNRFMETFRYQNIKVPDSYKSTLQHNLVFTGRCGSTLLCKALEELSTVQAVSEPDIFTTIGVTISQLEREVKLPYLNKISHATLVDVTRVAILLLNYYFISVAPEKTSICYKLRSFGLDGAEIIQESTPNAKNIYLYRNCYAFVESYIRILAKNYYVYWLLSTLRLDAWFLDRLFPKRETDVLTHSLGKTAKFDDFPFRKGFYWCFSHAWWINVEKAALLIKKDPDSFFHAVLRYEDLTKQKEKLVKSVAQRLGVKLVRGDEQKIASAFTSNSQEGNEIASKRNTDDDTDVWFGDWEKGQINDILSHLGNKVKSSHYIVEGTI
ncbi:predicted protein [Nematostella vectensis]|uniref:Sulfotransferase domain-containing protein n=1 Tax=Nematostella vectensis TaxID=45351 RepID=A7RHY0_NEMVE|nr:predicted protein [Nematostella vectensis]|eukprot:XP_001641118.1 predicted protein [Nematostella vectensis]